VLLLDKLGRTTRDRVEADVQEGIRARRASTDDEAVIEGRRSERSASKPMKKLKPQLMLERAAATEKPSTVTKPATLPACCAAWGIIESISITSRAPAAKPSTAA
jgi:hypothetical protein